MEEQAIISVPQDNRLSIFTDVSTTIVRLRDLDAKVKEQAKVLEDRLSLHAGYADAKQAVEQAQKGKKDARSAVMADNPDLLDLSVAVKQLRSDLKRERDALSDLLLEYEQQTGSATLETEEGVLVRIRKTASVQMKLF